jgi:AmiR/NasT family two-component response regulator
MHSDAANSDLADMAAALLRSEQRGHELTTALEGRDVVGLAKGILMATEIISSDAAFDVLRRASQRENRKLRDVAADLVAARNVEAAARLHN